MFFKFLMKPFDFTDTDARFYTNILSGEIGSGKTSFMVKYLYFMLVNKEFLTPFKTVYINIDGLDFIKFKELAQSNGLDIEFKWLDMNHFKKFAYAERELYTTYNSDGNGSIAKRIAENIDDEYKKYIASMIICDEADHYMTKKDEEFANFLKFKRHHSIEIWFITQKFQNLHDSYYNSGAINRFLRVRSSLFNLGNSRVIQLWANSNTAKIDNMIEQTSYEIELFIYNLYDVGAVLKTGDQAQQKLKFYFILFIASIIFSGFVFYWLLGDYVNGDEATKTIKTNTPVTAIEKNSNEPLNIVNVVKCVTFSDVSNCYFDDSFASVPNGFILGLMDKEVSNIHVIYTYDDTSFLSVDDNGLNFIFQNIKRDENENNK